jgi:predicted nucleic acid-binding protein
MMILIDSNIIIYAASGNYPALTDWLAEQNAVVSAVTILEVMGYHKLQTEEKTELENLFSQFTVMYPNPDIFRCAISLRQDRKVSLGDALIAATALTENFPLATHNTSDFSWIPGLSIIDPLEQKK